jgi:hypothetical protein
LTQRLDLDQPRASGALLTDSLRIYGGNFLTFIAISLAVVLPAELIVSGVGLGQLSSGYHLDRPLAARMMPDLVRVLVTTPLIAAAVVFVLLDLAAGQRPRVRRAIQSGLDAFAHVFVPVAAAFAVEAVLLVPVILVATAAVVPLLAIPLVLAVRWYFAPQAVVVAGKRRLEALRGSWELTRGAALRTFLVAAISYLAATYAAGLIASPMIAVARALDSGALVVAFNVVAQSLATPAVTIVAALLYFDLRSRSR